MGRHLLTIARDLFYRAGIHTVSINDICKAAKVTKPTLYRHFVSKDEPITACVSTEADGLYRQLCEAIELAGPEPSAQIRAVANFYADALTTRWPRGLLEHNAAVEFPQDDHPVRQVAVLSGERLRARLVLLVGAITGACAADVSTQLLLLNLGAHATCQALGGDVAADALRRSVDALLRSLRLRSGLGDRCGSPHQRFGEQTSRRRQLTVIGGAGTS